MPTQHLPSPAGGAEQTRALGTAKFCRKPSIFVVVLTFACLSTAVLFRTRTWRARFESSWTLSLTLLGFYIVLTDGARGHLLQQVTGIERVIVFTGHLCGLAAAVAFIHYILERLADHDDVREIFRAWINWPITLIVALMFAALASAAAPAGRGGPLIDSIPDEILMRVYEITWYSGLVYLCALIVRLLLLVREDPDSRATATCYLIGAVGGGLGCILCPASDLLDWPPGLAIGTIVGGVGICVAAVAASVSWWDRNRPLRRLRRLLREAPDADGSPTGCSGPALPPL